MPETFWVNLSTYKVPRPFLGILDIIPDKIEAYYTPYIVLTVLWKGQLNNYDEIERCNQMRSNPDMETNISGT